MKSLKELFYECAYVGNWQVAGEDTDYKFVEDKSTLYIYFKGSDSDYDWRQNFSFGKRPYKDMSKPYRVHKGFLKEWKDVEDIIIDKIKDTKYKSIIIVGYSLGGAIAWFCHELCWFHRKDIRDNIFGFGFEAPRVYASWFISKELQERWKNFLVIKNNNDIVVSCPPLVFGYRHVSDMLHIEGDTSLVEGKLPKCIKSHYPQCVLDGLIKQEKDL